MGLLRGRLCAPREEPGRAQLVAFVEGGGLYLSVQILSLPCEVEGPPHPVLPTPGLLEDTACPPVQWPVGTRGHRPGPQLPPTLRTTACFLIFHLSAALRSLRGGHPDVHKLSNAARDRS